MVSCNFLRFIYSLAKFIALEREMPLTFASLIGYSIISRASLPYISTIASAVLGPKPFIRPLDKNLIIPSILDGGRIQMSSATIWSP